MKRIVIDLGLLAVFLTVLDLEFTRVELHECFGLAMILVLLVHLVLNNSWFTSFGRGRWTALRVLNTVVDFGLIASFLVTVVTGICISAFVFRGIMPIDLARNMTLHRLHVWAPFVLLIFVGLHVGLHGRALWMRFSRWAHLPESPVLVRALQLATVLGGVWASFAYRIGDRLQMVHMFGIGGTPTLGRFFLSYLAIIGLYAVIASLVQHRLAPKPQANVQKAAFQKGEDPA